MKRTEERRKEMEEKTQGDNGAAIRDLGTELLHKLPQLIFLSLPFLAMFLKLMYFRSKHRLYVDHLIFSIYQYSYLYAMLTVFLVLSMVTDKIGNEQLDSVMDNVKGVIILYLFVYLLLAMKRFYVTRWRYLIPKYFLLMFLMTFTIIFLAAMVSVVTYLL